MLKHLDLFSGIGGFSLGLESAGLVETVAFCDFDKYCQQILKKNFPGVPIYEDVKELNYDKLKADGIDTIDIITGGYPCQPFSVAGRKKGEEDPRHVWPEMFRLVQELRPTWVIGENVGGHIKLGLDTVLENLESEGYSTRTFSISASSIGANHKRERVWIIANLADSQRLGRTEGTKKSEELTREESSDQFDNRSEGRIESEPSQVMADSDTGHGEQQNQEVCSRGNASDSSSQVMADSDNTRDRTSQHEINQDRKKINEGWQEQSFSEPSRQSEDVADSEGSNRDEHEINREHGKASSQEIFGNGSSVSGVSTWWSVEPDVGRVAHGVPNRVDRLKCLGNSVVPQIPYVIGLSIKKILENE
jgi:DNA (cytosine-5)-methyltransferase 1